MTISKILFIKSKYTIILLKYLECLLRAEVSVNSANVFTKVTVTLILMTM